MTKVRDIDITNPPDWDALWSAADIPGGRNEDWRRVLGYRTKLPDDAIRLAAAGWTPELVVAARDNPEMYMPDARVREARRGWAEVSASHDSKLVLADETAKWHESRMQLARELRWHHMHHLVNDASLGWSHQMIGDLIGLTRQRVRAILRSDLSRVWRDD